MTSNLHENSLVSNTFSSINNIIHNQLSHLNQQNIQLSTFYTPAQITQHTNFLVLLTTHQNKKNQA
jgi:hypothetical protein